MAKNPEVVVFKLQTLGPQLRRLRNEMVNGKDVLQREAHKASLAKLSNFSGRYFWSSCGKTHSGWKSENLLAMVTVWKDWLADGDPTPAPVHSRGACYILS